MHHYGDNFVFVVPEDHPLHTTEQPLCGDPTCPCYDDVETIAAISDAITEGTITTDDANSIIQGKTV